MQQALDAYPAPAFAVPEGITTASIDTSNGKLAGEFLEGWHKWRAPRRDPAQLFNRFGSAAGAAQRRAIAREPNQPRQYLMLAEILDKMGRTSEAQTARDDATRLKALVTSPRVAAN
jgi:hypothetical protein